MQRRSNGSALLLDSSRAETAGGSGLDFPESELLLDHRESVVDSELLLDRNQGGSHPASPS